MRPCTPEPSIASALSATSLGRHPQVHGGVRALSLRRPDGQGPMEVLSGGADGVVRCWTLEEVAGARPDGTPMRGAKLGKTDKEWVVVAAAGAGGMGWHRGSTAQHMRGGLVWTLSGKGASAANLF